MINRPFWTEKIVRAWNTRPIVWLSGVRRVGKTSLAQLLPNVTILNCDLPSTQRKLEDPESYLKSLPKRQKIVFDEIHQLTDPSRILKIAADVFPSLRVLATGSSTLAATRKFRDSLSGRKWNIYLPPVLLTECRENFGSRDLDKRFLHGGLPEALMSQQRNAEFYEEWIDSYYARDIAELFQVRQRTGFLLLLRLLMNQSGGLADLTKLASESGLSRHTVKAHIEAMTIAHAMFPIHPFHGGGRREIVHRPKIYAFDTGFVAYARGWDSIRADDRGLLWEHLVLDGLRAAGREDQISYWRDKSGRELDFVLRRGGKRVDVIECKIHASRFDPETLIHFRSLYPEGENWVATPDDDSGFTRRMRGLEVWFCGISQILSGKKN
jgi:uncharacterized protein